jgi:hypothetical protein
MPVTEQRKYWYRPTEGRKETPADKAARAGDLINEAATIEQYQRSWHEMNLWNATLYSNRELVGFSWGATGDGARELWPVNLVTENIIEEIGEAMLSKASASPIRPSLVPHGNSWKTERAVRLLEQFTFGVWKQTESEDAAVRAYLDAYISSIGCVLDTYDKKKGVLSCEPVFFDNIIVDNRECLNRQQPRTLRIRRILPREAVEETYGVDLGASPKYASYRQLGEGYVIVVEAWRKNGRHTVACCDQLLVDEAWDEDWWPAEFYHWGERLSGFFGRSGVETLVPYQVRQNELNDAITESQDIACRPRLLAQANSQLDLSQWDNQAGRILGFAGMAPTPLVWPTNLAELYNERERNFARAMSHVALSEMFGNADLPQQVRLDSSAGVREMRNMEDARHLRQWTRFEVFRLRIAMMHLRVLGRQKGAEAFTTAYHPARAKAAAKTIQWQAVKDLTADKFSWTMEAAPLSQQSPAARRETLRDWVSRGLMNEQQAERMLTNPNIELIESLEMASVDDVHRHIEVMEDGNYESPTELTNLPYGIWAVTANYHRLRNYEDVDADVIDNHLNWIAEAVSITQMATQAAQPAPFAPTQGMPGTSASTSPHTLIQSGNNSQFGM